MTVTATDLTSLSSTATTANKTDSGSAQTVSAGQAITMGETFTTGNAANYNQVLNCTGNAMPLSGNLLTVNTADVNIVCTYTNTRRTVTLRKTWVNAIVNDAVNVSATGLALSSPRPIPPTKPIPAPPRS